MTFPENSKNPVDYHEKAKLYEQVLAKYFVNSMHRLPDESAWLELIDNIEDAKGIGLLMEECEAVTAGLLDKVAEETGTGGLFQRTNAIFVDYFEHGLEIAGRVELKLIPVKNVVSTSSGNETREMMIRHAINEFGTDATFEKLPPVLVEIQDDGNYRIIDGATRLSVAKQDEVNYIRAYVFPKGTEERMNSRESVYD
jgi:hypothetical protein